MATDPRKRQRKLERRSGKRKAKKHVIAKEQTAGLAERMTAAARYPVLHSSVAEVFWTEGIGQVLLSRLLPNGTVAVAVFLIDRYCLGVKDAFAVILSRSSYDERFVRDMRSHFEVRAVAPAMARKLVEDAVAYARNIGFPPPADYLKAKVLFGDIDAGECQEEFEFGKDGKPFFVAGPNDTPERCRQILSILTHSCGPNGYHYFMPFGEASMMPSGFLPGNRSELLEFDDDEDDEDDEP